MLIGQNENYISQREFSRYFEDRRLLNPEDLPRNDGSNGARALAFEASKVDPASDTVLHTEAEWEALYDLFADRYGAHPDRGLEVRGADGRLTALGQALSKIDRFSDRGEKFWERSDVLRVRVKGLPQHVDPGQLRSGGIEGDFETTMWFGGPNSETLGDVVLQGAEWSVQHRGETEVYISGNNSLWDESPTWRVEVDDANVLPIESGKENLKLAQNNRDPLSGVRRMLSRELYQLAGVTIGRARPAEVSLQFGSNLSFQGHRTLLEPPESTVRRAFPFNDDGNLYELNWTNNGPADLTDRPNESTQDLLNRKRDIYDLKGSNDRDPETNNRKDLALLVDRLNADPRDPSYAKNLEEVLDVKGWLRALSVSVLTGNWDGFVDTASNGYLYNSGHDGDDSFMEKPYFTFIPNDTDNSLGSSPRRDGEVRNFAYADMFHPQDHMPGGPKMPMIEQILTVPEFRDYYVEFTRRFMDQVFNPSTIDALIGTQNNGTGNTGFWPQIRDSVYREGNFSDPPRTKRWHSNDAVFKHGVNHQELDEGWRVLFGIKHHVNMAHGHFGRMIDRYQPADPGRQWQDSDFPIGTPTPVKVG